MKKPSPVNDQPHEATPDMDPAGSGETDPAGPDSRHWLKYAGIGGRRQKPPGDASALGEDVTSLGSLEAEVLGLLWEIGQPATGMEVMEASLYKRRAQGLEPAAFATVATTLRRLTGKGVLHSQKNGARTPVYWPTVGREQMAARILNNVSQTLLGTSLHGLLPKLIGRSSKENGNPEEEKELQQLMDALEQVAKADMPKISRED